MIDPLQNKKQKMLLPSELEMRLTVANVRTVQTFTDLTVMIMIKVTIRLLTQDVTPTIKVSYGDFKNTYKQEAINAYRRGDRTLHVRGRERLESPSESFFRKR